MIDKSSDLTSTGARNRNSALTELIILPNIDPAVIMSNSDSSIHAANLATGKPSIFGLKSIQSKDL